MAGEFLKLLEKRRSIRNFTEQKIEEEKVDYLIECMLRSPSSRSLNPWEFVVVDDKATIEALSKSKTHGAAFAKGAPLVMVICADPQKCDVWVEDTSISTILAHLAAEDLGLGSCWIQVRMRPHNDEMSAEQYIKETLALPENMVVEAMVAVGYPVTEKEGWGKDTLLYDRINYNRYGNRA